MAEFIKVGERIKLRPNVEGLEFNLEGGKIYDLKYCDMTKETYLQENGSFNMPKKVYKVPEDDEFKDRVLTYFNSDKAGNTTGVLLAGTKGTGKTILAKRIAIDSNLPVIIPANNFYAHRLNTFFKQIKSPVVVMFDEVEKNDYYWDTKDLLGFLDGVEATAKKLVLMTCNDTDEIDDNFFDRCSRIRYFREYEANSNTAFIKLIAKDKGIEDIDKVADFITNNMGVKSFDNINSFLDEVILFKDKSYEDIIKYMNVSEEEC